MSIWMLLAVGVTLNGEPRAMAQFYPDKNACEQVRMLLDDYIKENMPEIRAHMSKCSELQVPDNT